MTHLDADTRADPLQSMSVVSGYQLKEECEREPTPASLEERIRLARDVLSHSLSLKELQADMAAGAALG